MRPCQRPKSFMSPATSVELSRLSANSALVSFSRRQSPFVRHILPHRARPDGRVSLQPNARAPRNPAPTQPANRRKPTLLLSARRPMPGRAPRTTCSQMPSPAPPTASGSSSPVQPASTMADQIALSTAPPRARFARSAFGRGYRDANPATLSHSIENVPSGSSNISCIASLAILRSRSWTDGARRARSNLGSATNDAASNRALTSPPRDRNYPASTDDYALQHISRSDLGKSNEMRTKQAILHS